ncbi:hypothetical protein DLREEDagr8_06390 [Dongia sp. agr-C8]
MADFQMWERGVLPQGSIVAPQAGPSLAESFGAGVSDLVSAATGAASAVQKADALRAEKQWEIDQPKAAALVNQLQLQIAEQLPELKAQAAPGLADYPDKINAAITRATEEALKEYSDPRVQRYVRGYMDAYRVSAATTGIQERTVATLKRDAAALQSLLEGQSKLVAHDFANYDTAVGLIDETLAANRHLGADRKIEFSSIAKHALAKAGPGRAHRARSGGSGQGLGFRQAGWCAHQRRRAILPRYDQEQARAARKRGASRAAAAAGEAAGGRQGRDQSGLQCGTRDGRIQSGRP